MKKIISLLIRYVPRKYLQLFTGLGLKTLGAFYAGNKVECPICSQQYRKFLPYGRINPRQNALCPSCLSLERHRLIWVYLKECTHFFQRKLNVLHLAPEPCFLKAFEKQHGDGYITADIESPLAKVKMDIHRMPFPDNQFDVVLCNHVLEHVANDVQAMREIHRVLKPGGFAILQVPFFAPVPEVTFEDPSITSAHDRERAFGQRDHVRRYGKDYAQRIALSGLHPHADCFAQTLSDDQIFRNGLVKNEVLFVAHKQARTDKPEQ